jgi:hypothetical protein
MVTQIGVSEPAKFELAGKEYRLRFTLTALKALASEHDVRIMSGGQQMLDNIRDADRFALILYYGLKAHHPEVTLAWVEETFDSAMLLELMPVLARAIAGSKADVPNEAGPDLPKANGIGLLSGPSEDMTSASQSQNSGN